MLLTRLFSSRHAAAAPCGRRPARLWAILAALASLALLAACSPAVTPAAAVPTATSAPRLLSPAELEAQHGLRVTLVAVTAAGGLVDVRLKFVDGQKAQALLGQPENFPTLQVAGVMLSAPEEGRPAELQFDDDANLFLLYPNAGGVVKPGTPVTIVFGGIQLEPIPAK